MILGRNDAGNCKEQRNTGKYTGVGVVTIRNRIIQNSYWSTKSGVFQKFYDRYVVK